MQAGQAAPDTAVGDQEEARGPEWQDAQSAARARAEVLLASWTDAEQEAAAERRRAEDLLAFLTATVQEPRPPPVPPPIKRAHP